MKSSTWNSIRSFCIKVVKFKFIFAGILVCNLAHALPTQISGVDLVKGNPVSLSFREANKGTVLIFLSALCPCSASHQDSLNRLAREFGPKGFRFVGVHSNVNESFNFAREYFGKSGLVFPVIQDDQAKIADQFEALQTPHAFVVSPKLDILFRGGVDNSKSVNRATKFYLRDALVAVDEGREPEDKKVRVFGCIIKRP